MSDYFKQQYQGFYAFNFCDWISCDFEDSMLKTQSGVRYDPSHGTIVYMYFIDAFNNWSQRAREIWAPHGDSDNDSNKLIEDEDNDDDDGGDKEEDSLVGCS